MSAESPRQEADGSNDADNKEFSCSFCERVFGSQPALNSHVGHKHPDEARETKKCDWCGDNIEMIKSQADAHNLHFCDRKCKGNYWSDNYVGEDHPRYDRVTVDCDYCGNKVEKHKKDLKYEHHYCDSDCHAAHVSEAGLVDGENNPVYNSVEKECVQCGETFVMPVSVYENGRKCCSNACAYNYKSEKYRGENNWNYTGYEGENYGKNWDSKRQQVRERDDYKCQDCGVNESEMSRELSVHHIIPLRKFDSPKEANKLDNLVSLCMSCHSKWEGIPLRPQ